MPSPECRNLIRERGVLETIRDKPAMWLGQKSISKLRTFYDGYFCCLEVQANGGLPWSLKEDAGMNSWTAYRLDVDPGSKGYVELLLEHCQDEALALDKFYEIPGRVQGA